MSLPPKDHQKLIRLCGMFGSDFDGERANAARMADEIIRRHKITWNDVLAPALPPPKPQLQGHVTTAEWLLQQDAELRVLTDWERRFLASVKGFRKISDRQRQTLEKLVERITDALEADHA